MEKEKKIQQNKLSQEQVNKIMKDVDKDSEVEEYLVHPNDLKKLRVRQKHIAR
ncbi:hypothetical protein [Spiroplasma endosymbiont of Nebria brevicollis]|uniref:hypothetical protein n=1 Tax=Spiroplasma endosymbiont of Nebria brevicollis TaxID=3066284 RepID=UPI00313ECAC5